MKEEIDALLANEATEDYLGLFEIVWSLNVTHPNTAAAHVIRVAQPAIIAALGKRTHQIFQTLTWPPVEFVPLANDLAIEVVSDAANWQIPGGRGGPAVIYWIGPS